MLAQFRLMARRHGMVDRLVTVPLDPGSDEEVVQVYADAITPRTRLLMVCHMINITGQILPVRKIVDMAHARGVQVMVDGAHTFAHIDFRIPDLGCDYFGTSLHKWLGVPLGAGLLFVRRDRIPALWPIYGDGDNPPDDSIMKLNHTGTHPVHTDLAIADAIDFHDMIGTERKEARLRHLTQYWTSRVRGLPNVVLNSPSDPTRTCGIANVGIRGVPPTEMAKTLLEEYGIWTVGIDNNGVQGCRITPHVFILPRELDTLVDALEKMAAAA
jgi:selenocysteine lyase/cysteine desulfurase